MICFVEEKRNANLSLINEQDPQPHTVIALWKSKIMEPKFQDSDPAMVIFDESTSKFFCLFL